MGGRAFCCRGNRDDRSENGDEGATPGCFSSYVNNTSERSLLARFTGKNDYTDEFGETRFKQLKFYDFDEEDKKNLIDQSHTDGGEGLDFDESEYDNESDYKSVDEGAIAILSMDEIRNMKKLELQYQEQQKLQREKIASHVAGQGQQKNALIQKRNSSDGCDLETPRTPRTSATGHLCIDMKQKLLLQSPKFDNKKLSEKLSELMTINKEMDSIDNGDVGSTKDYPSDNEDNVIDMIELEKQYTFKTALGDVEIVDCVDLIVDNSEELQNSRGSVIVSVNDDAYSSTNLDFDC